MKKVIIGIILLVLLSGCQKAPSHERGEALFDDGKFEAAAEVYELLVEDDDEDFDAWLALSDAWLADESYNKAEATLEDMMTLLIEDFEQRQDRAKRYISLLSERVEILIDETGHVGDWYRSLQPDTISLDVFEFTQVAVGSKIVLDLAEDVDVFYNFSGDSVTSNDIRYMDGIEFVQTGNYTLSVAAISELGISGEESRAFISVVSPESLLPIPRINYETGTYEGPVTIRFTGYEGENQDIYYTLDGSAPEYGDYYDHETGLVLYAGTYEVVGKIYDWQQDIYSAEVRIAIEVTGAESEAEASVDHTLHMAVLTENEDISAEVMWTTDKFAIEAEVDIETHMYDSIESLLSALESGRTIDVIYTSNSYTVDLYNYIGDVTYIADITTDYDYYGDLVESTFFWDAYYCLPVTAKPMNLLYYNYADLVGYYNDGIRYEDFIFEMDVDPGSSGITFKSATDPYTFMAIYHGYEGTIANELGYLDLDLDPLTMTFDYYKTMAEQGYINPDSDMSMWEDMLYFGDGDFIVADPLKYYSEGFSISYEPTTSLPLTPELTAPYPVVTDGLMVAYSIAMDSGGYKAGVIKALYEYMATDFDNNYYIVNTSSGLPAMTGVANEVFYEGILDLNVYESILDQAPPLSLDLEQLFEYTEIESLLYDVMTGTISPEDGAVMFLEMIDDAYLD